jgi:hypothetical protein
MAAAAQPSEVHDFGWAGLSSESGLTEAQEDLVDVLGASAERPKRLVGGSPVDLGSSNRSRPGGEAAVHLHAAAR